jgi:hypothetical protein
MPREGGTAAAAAGHTKLLLCVTQYTILCYCRIQETPEAPEDTRGNRGRHQREEGGHEGNTRDTRGTEGHSGGTEGSAPLRLAKAKGVEATQRKKALRRTRSPFPMGGRKMRQRKLALSRQCSKFLGSNSRDGGY